MTLRYFTLGEFRCPCVVCSPALILPGEGSPDPPMHDELLVLLDQTRRVLGAPITVTSGYRCSGHNAAVGGASGSLHTMGQAADLRCAESVGRYKLVRALLECGAYRIEIAPRHLHVEVRDDKWLGIWLGTST